MIMLNVVPISGDVYQIPIDEADVRIVWETNHMTSLEADWEAAGRGIAQRLGADVVVWEGGKNLWYCGLRPTAPLVQSQ